MKWNVGEHAANNVRQRQRMGKASAFMYETKCDGRLVRLPFISSQHLTIWCAPCVRFIAAEGDNFIFVSCHFLVRHRRPCIALFPRTHSLFAIFCHSVSVTMSVRANTRVCVDSPYGRSHIHQHTWVPCNWTNGRSHREALDTTSNKDERHKIQRRQRRNIEKKEKRKMK